MRLVITEECTVISECANKCAKLSILHVSLAKLSLCFIGSWIFQIIHRPSYAAQNGAMILSKDILSKKIKVYEMFMTNNQLPRKLLIDGSCILRDPIALLLLHF